MLLPDLDWVSVFLRALVYAGTICCAGGILVRTTIPAPRVNRPINLQISIGLFILIICEPLRYVAFQLSIAQGDWKTAFDPTLRWMAIETPQGHAAGMRLLGAALVLMARFRGTIAVTGAILMISSYLLEGHTVSSNNRALLAILLFVHLAVAHWWIAALYPLRAILTNRDTTQAAQTVELFGRQALVAVGLLTVAGALMLGELTGWQMDASSAYQQAFALKLALFAIILALAARNKLRWTPRLTVDPDRARPGLARAISGEMAVAALIGLTTAIATSYGNLPHG
ncbi:MAG: CopD family protein [Pseudomonadota bacterium]